MWRYSGQIDSLSSQLFCNKIEKGSDASWEPDFVFLPRYDFQIAFLLNRPNLLSSCFLWPDPCCSLCTYVGVVVLWISSLSIFQLLRPAPGMSFMTKSPSTSFRAINFAEYSRFFSMIDVCFVDLANKSKAWFIWDLQCYWNARLLRMFWNLVWLLNWVQMDALAEILVLGCGKRMGRVSKELRNFLRSNGIKLEAIDTVLGNGQHSCFCNPSNWTTQWSLLCCWDEFSHKTAISYMFPSECKYGRISLSAMYGPGNGSIVWLWEMWQVSLNFQSVCCRQMRRQHSTSWMKKGDK